MSGNHVDRATGTLEQVFEGIGKRVDALDAKARKAADEVNQSLDFAEDMIDQKLVAANNKLRGFLGMNSNFPPKIEGQRSEGNIDRGRAEDAEVVGESKPAE